MDHEAFNVHSLINVHFSKHYFDLKTTVLVNNLFIFVAIIVFVFIVFVVTLVDLKLSTSDLCT